MWKAEGDERGEGEEEAEAPGEKEESFLPSPPTEPEEKPSPSSPLCPLAPRAQIDTVFVERGSLLPPLLIG